jgi:hypothetical protein
MTARQDKTSRFWQGMVDMPTNSQNRESYAWDPGRTEVRPAAYPRRLRQGAVLIPSYFVLLALCCNMVGTAIYARKCLRNEVQPHLVTFFLWAVAPFLVFAAQVSAKAGIVSIITLVMGMNPALIFVLSLRRPDAHWSVSRFDVACGLISLAGLWLWWSYRNPIYTIVFAIASDLLASVPTYRKSITSPTSESPVLYVLAALGAFVTLLTIHDWTLYRYGFALYILCVDLSLAIVITVSGALRRGSLLRVSALR